MLLQTKYYARPLTRNIAPERLYGLTRKWVDLMWPVSGLIRGIPRIGHSINWRLLVADYSFAGVSRDLLKEWAYLDTFDMLAPRYDSPQTLSTMRGLPQPASTCVKSVMATTASKDAETILPPDQSVPTPSIPLAAGYTTPA
jgi:hypothetical protein